MKFRYSNGWKSDNVDRQYQVFDSKALVDGVREMSVGGRLQTGCRNWAITSEYSVKGSSSKHKRQSLLNWCDTGCSHNNWIETVALRKTHAAVDI